MPSVLRLRYYVNVPRRGVGWSRRGVLTRDHYTCQYCGKRLAAHTTQVVIGFRRTPLLLFGEDLQNNVKPNRLAASQAGAESFLQILPPGFNVALVAFAGTASVIVPPRFSRGRSRGSGYDT